MKVYMLITDADNITIDNIFFVSKKADAERIVEYGEASYYETINVLNSIEVEDILKSKLARG